MNLDDTIDYAKVCIPFVLTEIYLGAGGKIRVSQLQARIDELTKRLDAVEKAIAKIEPAQREEM